MKATKIFALASAFIAFSALAVVPNYSLDFFSKTLAAETGPVLKLLKPAKLHVDASGPSKVLETVWKGETCVWLDKKDVWVQVRMDKDGHTGWIHHSYLAPVMNTAEPIVEGGAGLHAVEQSVMKNLAKSAVDEAVAETVVESASAIEEVTSDVVAGDHGAAVAESEAEPVKHNASADKKEEISGHHGPVLSHANIDVTDQAQIRRGLTVFTDVCMGCHSAKYITFRGLMAYPEIGLTREEVDELRGDKSLMSGMISDLSIEDAVLSYGKTPPDLSLIVPGRRGGADYVYSLLTGYVHDEHGKVPDGNYNAVFPGNRIAMPDPLSWLDHEADEEAELKQQAEDVSAFLAFIGDPHQNERRTIGYWVMGFLILLTLVLWRLKVEVWKDVKH